MDENFSSEALFSFLRQNILLVSVSVFGLLLLSVGFFLLQPKEEGVVYEAGSERDSGVVPQSGTPQNDENKIFVDIAGAVVRPGVYKVASDARVQEVLTKAGGLAEEADRQGIAKSINLAARVSDGMKLYFPYNGETASVLGSVSSAAGGGVSQALGGLVNVNSASQAELESLPGVGAVTAGKIIKARPYASVEELKTKKVVGNAVYEKIKDQVTIN